MIAIKRNAIIMAAGTSSRFVPLSAEKPKGLLEVKGEILIERQIRQLYEANITDITVIVGYKAEMFEYLKEKFDVEIVYNEDFYHYNNTSSLIRVVGRLGNTYICSSDNYFPANVFLENPADSYYSALYADGNTDEYCLRTDENDNIVGANVGGRASWYMIGHVYFNEEFSKAFRDTLINEYKKEDTRHSYWEDVYIRFINTLPKLKIHRYQEGSIKEFDSIDELRLFDHTYISDTRSSILKYIADRMGRKESDLSSFKNLPHDGSYLMFSFIVDGIKYYFDGRNKVIKAL